MNINIELTQSHVIYKKTKETHNKRANSHKIEQKNEIKIYKQHIYTRIKRDF